MPDALYLRPREDNRITAVAAIAAGEVRQLADGRAAVFTGLNGAASGDRVNFTDTGKFTLTKTSGIVLLDGGRAYWDHSANAVHFKKVNDRDFYLGRVVGDAASADTVCVVDFNVDPQDTIDLLRDGVLSVATGTVAAGGFDLPRLFGGAIGIRLTATNEAQCVDVLSVDRVATAAKMIAEFIVRMENNGSTNAIDFNVGLANGTSTTDADAVTQHCYFHVDGNALDIFAQSKDGTTTVNATDTTIDITAGTAVANRFEFWIDGRDPTNVKLYINGVRVLSATTFKLDAATGPLGLLFHLEKTSSTATAGWFYLDAGRLRTAKQ